MKGKIITVDPVGDFYIIEETDYKNKKYALAIRCDIEQNDQHNLQLNLFSINIENNNLVLNNVEEETAKIVTNMIMEKIQNNN